MHVVKKKIYLINCSLLTLASFNNLTLCAQTVTCVSGGQIPISGKSCCTGNVNLNNIDQKVCVSDVGGSCIDTIKSSDCLQGLTCIDDVCEANYCMAGQAAVQACSLLNESVSGGPAICGVGTNRCCLPGSTTSTTAGAACISNSQCCTGAENSTPNFQMQCDLVYQRCMSPKIGSNLSTDNWDAADTQGLVYIALTIGLGAFLFVKNRAGKIVAADKLPTWTSGDKQVQLKLGDMTSEQYKVLVFSGAPEKYDQDFIGSGLQYSADGKTPSGTPMPTGEAALLKKTAAANGGNAPDPVNHRLTPEMAKALVDSANEASRLLGKGESMACL